MTDNIIPFDRNTEELPDRNGTPVRVGDYVRVADTTRGFDDAPIRQVTGLTPRQVLRAGHKPSGELDLKYSSVDTRWQGSGEYVREFASGVNLGGYVHQGRSLPDIERVELTDAELRAIRLREIDVTLGNIDSVIAVLGGRKRDLETQKRLLMEGRDS